MKLNLPTTCEHLLGGVRLDRSKKGDTELICQTHEEVISLLIYFFSLIFTQTFSSCRSKDIKRLLVSFMYLQSLLQPKNRSVLC